MALLSVCWTASAQAQTWLATPGSGDWNTAANWNPATVPDSTTAIALFGTSNTTAVSLSSGVAVDSIAFNGTSAYTLDLNGQLMVVHGTGIFNTSGLTQTIIVSGILDFKNGASAGGSDIAYSLQNGGSGSAQFQNSSTLGSATFTVNSGSVLQMLDTSTGGAARIIDNGQLLMQKSDGILGIGSLEGNGVVISSLLNGGAAAQTLTVGTANTSTAFSGQILDGTGVTTALTKTGTGTLTLTGANTYTGDTTIGNGTLALTGTGSIATSGLVNLTASLGTFDISGTTAGASIMGLKGAANSTVTLGSQTLTITAGSSANAFSGNIGGSGGLTIAGNGVLILNGANSYTGATTINSTGILGINGTGSIASSSKVINNGSLDLSVISVDSSIKSLAGTNAGSNLFLGNHSLNLTAANDTYAGQISGTGGLTLSGGTETLTGSIGYSGATTINGGTLVVNNSLASSSGVTVNTGGTLMGTGAVGNTSIAGGTFAPGSGTPGSSLTVFGTLGLTAASTYAVNINPTTSSFATVSGAATLGGATVNAIYANGSYVAKQYTILTAGSFVSPFGSVVNTNLPAGFISTLAYDPTHAYLNLALSFTPPTTPTSPGSPGSPVYNGLNGNQQHVANALINFFNATGGIPLVFGALAPAGLSQVSGETATGSQQATFDAMTQFMNVMMDPFMAGRGEGFDAPGGAPSGYASSEKTGAVRDANAMFVKGPVTPFEARWSTWAAGFGGSQTTDGNATVGSNSATSRVYGTAVGADYRFSPFTIAGFSLAGGGTSFSVNNSGTGHSDLFQAGAFVRHNVGQAYISGAIAYGWQDITTDRTVTAAGIDRLHAEFNANTFSGRVEAGYRFVAPLVDGGVGITPYAAGQATTFSLPSYAESVVSGAGTFALAYGARDVTDSRTELGLRTDKSFAMPDAVLTLRGRFAWAHDYNPDRAVGATFQTLPGASFVVNGAAQASDSALTTASAEWKWISGWSTAATFEGEFSNVTRSYAGKGVVRYAW
ncbi:autotransporter domain-containing protein [Bradyrhizobium sp. dw_411]|uniref:autotransporter outer membrane beta-barrel domain-containing protein n=1 Tax=Bradyrhizobium sp. dw_411 TaxID=2720082 RepID=UPI001BCE4E33